METKCKIWIEKNGRVVFGEGRDRILKAIDQQHGLYTAAKKLEISYRGAWGRLKASEERMGLKLVDRKGVKGKAMQLTEEAQAIIDRFDKLEKDMKKLLRGADQDFKKLIREDGK